MIQSRRHPTIREALLLCVLVSIGCDRTPAEPECAGLATIQLDPPDAITLVRVMGAELIRAAGRDACGNPVALFVDEITWSSSAPAVAVAEPVQGARSPTGVIRGMAFGTAEISVAARGVTATLGVEVRKPEQEASGFTVLGAGHIEHSTTDLWVHGDFAYSGSQPWRCGASGPPCESLPGWLYVWRLRADGGLEKVDSLALPAPKINDVKVSADGSFAIASQERVDAANGIVVLDLADPASPAVVAHHTAGLEEGVHNVWIERLAGRDYAFVAENGNALDGGLHILDVTDRATPTQVARFHAGDSFVHDVYVRDGLAFVAHWNAGLIILDVGNGMAGGSPNDPVEVGRVVTEGGHVHNAWYWPDGQVVFVGEEQFPPPERIDEVGVVHVIDVSDMTAPNEIAHFGVPGATPHNFWLDEERGILFAAWYDNGLRAIDVTGTLAGDLGAQGRELGHVVPSGHRGAASIWAPQLHQGRIYLSDIFNGLWSVRFDR